MSIQQSLPGYHCNSDLAGNSAEPEFIRLRGDLL
jgi:hypothetical protein